MKKTIENVGTVSCKKEGRRIICRLEYSEYNSDPDIQDDEYYSTVVDVDRVEIDDEVIGDVDMDGLDEYSTTINIKDFGVKCTINKPGGNQVDRLLCGREAFLEKYSPATLARNSKMMREVWRNILK